MDHVAYAAYLDWVANPFTAMSLALDARLAAEEAREQARQAALPYEHPAFWHRIS